ncbi:MAG: methylated-DNA--[protein]-cysteine S-methyltransferase, partial [Bacilli bacterium]
MFYDYYLSPVGLILISANHNHLLQISYVLSQQEEIKTNTITKETKNQLIQYFNLERATFDLPILFDNSFSSQILQCLYHTPIAQTLSYKELGQLAQSKAYQAIGSVMRKNPLPIIIPCHRVI